MLNEIKPEKDKLTCRIWNKHTPKQLLEKEIRFVVSRSVCVCVVGSGVAGGGGVGVGIG